MTPRLRSWLIQYSFNFKTFVNGKEVETDVYESQKDWDAAFKKFRLALMEKRQELAEAA